MKKKNIYKKIAWLVKHNEVKGIMLSTRGPQQKFSTNKWQPKADKKKLSKSQ